MTGQLKEFCDAEWAPDFSDKLFFGTTLDLSGIESCNEKASHVRFDEFINKKVFACNRHLAALKAQLLETT